MDNIIGGIITFNLHDADQSIAHAMVGLVAFLAFFLPLGGLAFVFKFTGGPVHRIYNNLQGKASNAGNNFTKGATGIAKGVTNDFGDEFKGRATAAYDPTQKPYRGKNAAIRFLTGNYAPTSKSTRKLTSAGSAYTQEEAKHAKATLDRSGVAGNAAQLVTLASGGSVTTASGGRINARGDSAMQRASMKALISSKNASEFGKLLQKPSVDFSMLNEEVAASYGDVKGMGAHLPETLRRIVSRGGVPTTDGELNSVALTETSKLSAGALATQDPHTIGRARVAAEGAIARAQIDPVYAASAQGIEAVQAANTLGSNARLVMDNPGIAKDVKTAAIPDMEALKAIAATAAAGGVAAATGATAGVAATAGAAAGAAAAAGGGAGTTGGGTTNTTVNTTVNYTQGYSRDDLNALGAGGITQIINNAAGGINNLSDGDIAKILNATRGSTDTAMNDLYSRLQNERNDRRGGFNPSAGPAPGTPSLGSMPPVPPTYTRPGGTPTPPPAPPTPPPYGSNRGRF